MVDGTGASAKRNCTGARECSLTPTCIPHSIDDHVPDPTHGFWRFKKYVLQFIFAGWIENCYIDDIERLHKRLMQACTLG